MGDIELLKCMSATFDFLTDDWHLVSLHGGWANERQITVRRLQEGTLDLSSRRGVSSHQMNPFCVLSAGPPQEDSGQCWGFSLLYSGNWIMELEQSETGCVRVNAGINPTQFSWDLKSLKAFESPEVVCVYSEHGLGDLTRTFHRLYSQRLINPRWQDVVCPVLINTWEALYFDVRHERVMNLARPAKEVGVELLVLDDGWFGQRDDDTSSLGDWQVNHRKLPRGLAGLAEDLNAIGMQLGIWMEPEMVNGDSELFRQHPDWVLHHPNRLRSEGRNQLVLDLSREEVQDYLIDSVSFILGSANITYVKWDMNRALTDAYSVKLPPRQQGEVYHRYVLGLYRVFETVTERFPGVLFESCASGGGRFDPALLAWCPQVWCSDNTDAFSRTRIQMGTSLWAPVRCMGAHITACPNHQTHRSVMMKTRFIVALFGTFGLELDVTASTPEERKELQELIQLRKALCPVTLYGEFFRLPGFGYPGAAHGNSAGIGESNVYAWMFVSPDLQRAVVSAIVFHRDTVGKFPSRLKLRGLAPEVIYQLQEHVPTPVEQGVFNGIFQPGGPRYKHQRALRLAGAVLMGIGLPIHFNFDGDSVLFELNAVIPEVSSSSTLAVEKMLHTGLRAA
jgi:alpha-galactosidase